MSYQTELQRLMEAKASMRQSIINKGVEVPEDVMIEDLPEYIAQITTKPADPTLPADDGTEWGTLYTTDNPEGVVLANETEFNNLAKGYNTAYIPLPSSVGNVKLANVTGYSFGKQSKITPDWFLCNLPNLTKLTCLGGLQQIGTHFLASAESFTQSMTLPASITLIKEGFLDRCNNYTGLLTINTAAVPAENYSLATNKSNVPMYVDGVRINGTGAAAWKAALADRTNPYRKLILEGA